MSLAEFLPRGQQKHGGGAGRGDDGPGGVTKGSAEGGWVLDRRGRREKEEERKDDLEAWEVAAGTLLLLYYPRVQS